MPVNPGTALTAPRLLLGVIIAAGALLRLDQFGGQVLLDDEWHAIHQLISARSPSDLFLNFGFADYSIPLGLLYWFEAQWFGLGEWGMRWPMLLAGLASLVLFPAYAWRRFSPRVAIMFATLLALSPMLLIYSRTARPYALTLLLSLSCIYFFYRYLDSAGRGKHWLLLYSTGFSLCVWLHPVTGPLVLAPLLLEAARSFFKRTAPVFRRLALAGVSAGGLTALLVLPPLLSSRSGLGWKAGSANLQWDTVSGVAHVWLGTPSLVCVLVLIGLSIAGLAPLLRGSRVAQSVLLGLGLTVLIIVVLKPASVNHPVTFGRYLLAAIPLLALAAALGADRLLQSASPWGRVSILLLAGVAVWYILESPLRTILARPNSHTIHSVFQADFRRSHNRILRYQASTLQVSTFWEGFAGQAPQAQIIAVAPFYFESYHWDAPRWEQTSRQRVIPAFLNGFCADRRNGEVADEPRFPLRNAYWLSRLEAAAKKPDWLVFTNPIPRFAGTPEGEQMREEARFCLSRLQKLLGAPAFKDDVLQAWRLQP